MRRWTITLQLGLFSFSFEKLSKNIRGKRGGKILFYSNSITRYGQVRIRENVLCRYIKDRHEGHLWTVLQAGIRRSVSRLPKVSPEPPKREEDEEEKNCGHVKSAGAKFNPILWSITEDCCSAPGSHASAVTAVCFSSKRRGTHRTACARLPPPL